jgi:hypothetical protein
VLFGAVQAFPFACGWRVPEIIHEQATSSPHRSGRLVDSFEDLEQSGVDRLLIAAAGGG